MEREKTEVSDAAHLYMSTVKAEQFSPEKVAEIANLGGQLVRLAGGYHEAARQLQKSIWNSVKCWRKT